MIGFLEKFNIKHIVYEGELKGCPYYITSGNDIVFVTSCDEDLTEKKMNEFTRDAEKLYNHFGGRIVLCIFGMPDTKVRVSERTIPSEADFIIKYAPFNVFGISGSKDFENLILEI